MIAISLEREKHIPLSSSAWIEEFWSNAAGREPLPWTQWKHADRAGDEPREPAAVLRALKVAGDLRSADRHGLSPLARQHADAMSEPDYWTTVRLMLHERDRHAQDLQRVVGPMRPDEDAADRAPACTLAEGLMDLAVEHITWSPLLRSIRRGAASGLVRQLCEQIQLDDERHLAFICEKLAYLQRDAAGPARTTRATLLHARVITGLARLWIRHASAFRMTGRSFAEVLSEARQRAAETIAQMNPSYWFTEEVQIDEGRSSASIRSAASNRFTARSFAS